MSSPDGKGHFQPDIKRPRQIGGDIKWSHQRIRKGYCDYDLFSVDDWFMKIMPEMLRVFKKTRHGSPDAVNYHSHAVFRTRKNEIRMRIIRRCRNSWSRRLSTRTGQAPADTLGEPIFEPDAPVIRVLLTADGKRPKADETGKTAPQRFSRFRTVSLRRRNKGRKNVCYIFAGRSATASHAARATVSPRSYPRPVRTSTPADGRRKLASPSEKFR